jgi:hypothetical protein
MAEESRSSFASPIPLIAAALLAAGVLVKNAPLETARPAGDGHGTSLSQIGYQDVEARLWQDPFAVRAVALPPRDLRQQRNPARDDPQHSPEKLSQLVDRALEQDPNLEIVGAMVFGRTYAEDAEMRRRARYAVISGLHKSGYEPDNADGLGYAWMPSEVRETADLGARLPEIVPYEWFTKTERGTNRLLLVWIQEEALGDKPIRALNRLAEKLICSYRESLASAAPARVRAVRIAEAAKECVERMSKRILRVVGPSGSGTLEAIRDELGTRFSHEYRPPERSVLIELNSAGATIANRHIPGLAILERAERDDFADSAPMHYKILLRRLATTDDKLAGALADELVTLRGLADPKPGVGDDGRNRCGTVVLISEADTNYGRILGGELDRAIRNRCQEEGKEPPRVLRTSYFRGLDGLVSAPTKADDAASGSKDREKGSAGKSAGDDVQLLAGQRERAEGRTQLDYLRRLGAELVDLDEGERRAGRSGIKAVGILGNDVYDKLLILQALHRTLPHATFFTTDLDARLLHPDQAAWARNLVVASGYGLSLRDSLQAGVPAFRDSYQAGAYFATLTALHYPIQAALATKAGKWFDRAQLFEIGRTRPVELTRGNGLLRNAAEESREDPCSLAAPERCDSIYQDPEISGTSRFVAALAAHWMLFGLAGIAGILLLAATSRTVWAHPAVFWGGIAAFACAFGWVTYVAMKDDRSGRGEPLEWFEGVSLWPTIYLLVLASLLASALLVYGWWLMRRSSLRLHRRFFGETKRGRASRVEAPVTDDSPPGGGEPVLQFERYLGKTGLLLAFIEQRVAPRGRPPAGKPNRRHLSAFIPFMAYGAWGDRTEVAHQAEDGQRVDARSVWRVHCWNGQLLPSTVRVGLSLALFMWISAVAFFFDPLNLPYRGEAAKAWASYATLASLVLCGALVFVVVDATRRATRLIRCITDRRTRWPDRVIAKHVRETRLPERHLEHWIDFRAVVELTKSVNTFIYFPFFVLLLLVVARSTLFDSLNFPLPLVAVLCGAVLYLVYCAMSLRSTAENARSVALSHYRDQLLLAKSGQVPDVPATSGGPVDAEKLRAQLEEIIERIKSTKDGAFAPLLQQPFLKGLLIPFGGFGGMSLLEHFAISPF